ncbi:ABC transporter permease [Neobacillus niacini]|uniref:ABC transporter permease n=1 Tax=Neobacillus niacini TaxID=86668 RepID=UPI0021CB254D|nr:ABC transporter permease [Neobacillus niacini]MCM3763768.1 ABC transporter permease [Neobacillus niacini]
MAWVEYIRRNKREVKFQLSAFGLVIDWTVFLYIVVPAIIALGVIDFQLWQAPPAWTSFTNVSLLGMILFFAFQFSPVRTYIERADELFVIQNLKYYQTLIQAGKWYTVLKTSLETALLILYILPIFKVGYQLSAPFVTIIYFYVFIWSLFIKLASRWFLLRGLRWWYRAFAIMAFIVYSTGFYSIFGPYIIFICTTVFILAMLVFLLKEENCPVRFFHAEAERERNEKWKWAAIFMRQSGEIEGIQRVRKYPFLNKNSRAIFSERSPEKVMTEMYWKWHIRKGRQLKLYLYFLFISFNGMTIIPSKVKFIVFLFILFAGYKIQEGIWKTFISHPFTRNLGAITEKEIIIAKAKKRSLTATWLVPLAAIALWAYWN